MEKYLPRIIDSEIENRLSYMGAILIEGPKWCGKSTTAKKHAKSVIEFQNPDNKKEYDNINNTMPSLFLEGLKPRLFDEWQMYPVVWDSIRTDLDKTGNIGEYILTGSAKPVEGSTMHTGTGRFSRIIMRPMSLFESGDSNGKVSLKDIFEGKDIGATCDLSLEGIAESIVRGGWPAALKIKGDNKFRVSKDYFENLIKEEVKGVDTVERNSEKMKLLLKSLSRNISTSTPNSTILIDIQNEFNDSISRPTLEDYLNTLSKLFVLEKLESTNLNIRSKYAIRTKPKRYFVDPSIATSALGLNPGDLLKDLNYFGFLFENLCIRDLRVYLEGGGASLSFYRDENDFEVDIIVRDSKDRWGAIEIKLGSGYVDEAANNLLTFKDRVDVKKSGEPTFLMVLTGGNYSYKREDGVYVVSIGTLKN